MIHIGTCSWAEKTLIESGEFYPPEEKTPEARLRYYARHFDTVEVDSSYYAIPDQRTAWLWDARTPDDFTFHIKAYGALTGHAVDPRSLPADIRSCVSGVSGGSRFAYIKDPGMLRVIAGRFIEALIPLERAAKMGHVLFQFPPWFSYGRKNREYVLFCKELMGDLAVAVEFRHGSWLLPQHATNVFDFLKSQNLTYVAADEPQYGTVSTVPFVSCVTTDSAYFRFHGRNSENWLKKNIATSLRYAYSYPADELAEFAPLIEDADRTAKNTYAMFNNCYRGFATDNALRLKQLLQGR